MTSASVPLSRFSHLNFGMTPGIDAVSRYTTRIIAPSSRARSR